MRYALIVLRNPDHALSSVRYDKIADAFLAGGVILDEVVLLPSDGSEALTAALSRLSCECDAVFVACEERLLPRARESVAAFLNAPFGTEYLAETEDRLYAVLPASDRGAEIAAAETVPAVDRRRKKKFSRMVVRAVSAPEEKVRKILAEAERLSGDKLLYNYREKFGETRIEMVYHSETPKMLADETMRLIATGLDEYIYAVEDVPLAQRVTDALRLHRLRLSTAESFTGGGVGGAIVSVPGASDVFFEGINAYDNQAKTDRLGVSPYTLKAHGAVSDEVAYEMAAGLIAQGHCDVSVATTGIAGPQSDHTGKPVGLCYIAVGTKERVRVFRFQLEGNREKITKTAINLALFLVYKEIK
ncbi:MAG: CinA family protein [Candidatus Gallimonas sp.]